MQERLVEYLYEALSAEFGVIIETDNVKLLRAKFYAIRKERLDIFEQLSILISPSNPSDLWIIKRSKDEQGREE